VKAQRSPLRRPSDPRNAVGEIPRVFARSLAIAAGFEAAIFELHIVPRLSAYSPPYPTMLRRATPE